MRRLLVLIQVSVLGIGFASAQTAPAPAKQPAAKPKTSTTAASPAKPESSKPVITIEHLCSSATAKPGQTFAPSCSTTISQAEMDKLLNSLNPEMPQSARRNIGNQLGEMTAYAAEAHDQGIDKSPEFEEAMKVTRKQVLAQFLFKNLQKKAGDISPAELQSYYDGHKDQFEDFNLVRVIIPRETPSKDKPVDDAAALQYAQDIRDRLVKGEDPKALQAEAYKHTNQTSPEPPVELGSRHRGSLPPTQAGVFDLKTGGVSQVFTDPSAYFIFKVASRDVSPLDKVTPDIKRAMTAERFKDMKAKLDAKFGVKLDDTYFGPEPQKAPAGAPSMRPQANGQAPFRGEVRGTKLSPEQEKEIQKMLEQQKQQQQQAPASSTQAPK